MVQVFLLNGGVEHRVSLTPNTPQFEHFLTWTTEVEISDEQEQATYPLIPVLEDNCEYTDSNE